MKAEFDSMKNDFQTQLDRYNSSIDNKIDGAISLYLEGISIAREKDLLCPVSDYNKIMWIRKYQLYGKKKTWSNSTTKSYESTKEEWLVPTAERRQGLRDAKQDYFLSRSIFGGQTIHIAAKLRSGAHPFAWGRQISQADAIYWCPPLCLMLKDTTVDKLQLRAEWGSIDNCWIHAGTYNNVTQSSNARRGDGNGLGPNGNNYPSDYHIDLDSTTPITFNTPATGFFLDFVLNGTFPLFPTASTTGWKVRNSDIVVTDLFSNQPLWTETYYTNKAGPTHPTYYSDCTGTKYFQDGVSTWYVSSDNGKKLAEYLNKGMAGVDWNQKVNVVRFNLNRNIGGLYPLWDTYSDYYNVEMLVDMVRYSDLPQEYTQYETQIISSSIPAKVNLPTLERVDLKAIYSGLYKTKTTDLRLGDGLPLLIESADAGELTIEFDYAVNRIIETATSSNKNRLLVSVKKSNFLDTSNTSTANFWNGEINGTQCTLYNRTLNISDSIKHVKITIPDVKVEDSVWIRISPTTDDGGYYATMNNLKMKMKIGG